MANPDQEVQDVVMTGASEPDVERGENRENHENVQMACPCPACHIPIDLTRPIKNYKAVMNDTHSAFVVAIRWYKNADSTDSIEPWRELLCLDIRHAIADWGQQLRDGHCRIELLSVCRCLNVYEEAVHNHKQFLQRLAKERHAIQQVDEDAAARALLSVATKEPAPAFS